MIFESLKSIHNSLYMEQIQSLLLGVLPLIPGANIRQLVLIVEGIYTISSGGVTQLNISRYSGISYRGVTRFMSLRIEWYKVYLAQLGSYFKGVGGVYLLVIDETVEDKSGKSTDKLGYFFCSKAKRMIKSVSFAVLSVVSVEKRTSYVVDYVQLEQDKVKAAANKADKLAKSTAAKADKLAKSAANNADKAAKVAANNVNKASKADKITQKTVKTAKSVESSEDLPEAVNRGGRPVGSTNKPKEKTDSVGFRALEFLLKRVLPSLKGLCIAPRYLVGDGAYGNITGCLIAREQGLDLISKLHHNSALYHLPEADSTKRKYGERVDFLNLEGNTQHPDINKIAETTDKEGIMTCFQIKQVRSEHIDVPFNLVIVRYVCLKTNKCSFCLLFSTDTDLDGETLMDYYTLRFQIEFNFRDAKQYFGLSDFKSIKPVQVTNAVGLSFFMVNLSHIISDQAKKDLKTDFVSIQDIKAYFRAVFYANRLKNTPDFSVPSFSDTKVIPFLALLGAVNLGQQRNKKKKAA